MKQIIYCLTLLFISQNLFSQLPEIEREILEETIPADILKQILAQGKSNNAKFRDEGDLLIATRRDNFQFGQVSLLDSTQHFYNDDDLKIEILRRNFDETEASWNVVERERFEYDINGNLTLEQEEFVVDENWVNDERRIRTYDGNNNLLTYETQNWVDDEWQNFYRWSYQYDAANNNVLAIAEKWCNPSWQNHRRIEYEFNGDHLRTQFISQSWEGAIWENMNKNIYEYDVNQNYIIGQATSWNGVEWGNDFQFNNTYNTNDDLEEALVFIYVDSALENNRRSILEYDQNNFLSKRVFENWNDTIWVFERQHLHGFEANGNELSHSVQLWDGMEWDDLSLEMNTYDANDNLIYIEFALAVFLDGNLNVESFETLYYEIATNTNENYYLDSKLEIYPNPSNGIFNVEIKGEQFDLKSLTVVNTLGMPLVSKAISNLSEINKLDLSVLPRGTYFIHINSEGQQLVEKIQIF